MKLTVLKENFVKKLSLVNHGVSSKNQLPVLLNILLIAENGTLTLKSTDLEIGIETKVSANIEEEGSVTVPAKIFLELVNSLTDDKLTFELEDKNLLIKTQKTKTKIQVISIRLKHKKLQTVLVRC